MCEPFPSFTPRAPARYALCAGARLGSGPTRHHPGAWCKVSRIQWVWTQLRTPGYHTTSHGWNPRWCAVTLVCAIRWRTRCEWGVDWRSWHSSICVSILFPVWTNIEDFTLTYPQQQPKLGCRHGYFNKPRIKSTLQRIFVSCKRTHMETAVVFF